MRAKTVLNMEKTVLMQHHNTVGKIMLKCVVSRAS